MDARAGRAVRVAASLTAGSALRQLGHHALAEPHDRRALRLASSSAERAHALVSLAADVVLTRPGVAARRLARVPARLRDPRARIRLMWVRAEAHLVIGHPGAAATSCERALALSRRVGFKRHTAKSLLFLGAALDAGGDSRRAARALGASSRIAGRIGARAVDEASAALLGRIARR